MCRVNFLSEPASHDVDVPDSVDPLPDLRSVLAIDGGARSIIFEPFSRRQDPAETTFFTRRLETQGADGRDVVVYRANSSPAYAAAFWRLSKGFLYTFLQDQTSCGSDLDDGMRTVAASIAVDENPNGLPSIELRRPLTPGDIRDPGQRDVVTFRAANGDGWPDIQLQRLPGWGRVVRGPQESAGFVEATAGASRASIRVTAVGPADQAAGLQDLADGVAASFSG